MTLVHNSSALDMELRSFSRNRSSAKMETEAEIACLEAPDAAVEEILAHLPLQKLVECSAVNKQWNRLAKSARIWEKHCNALWDEAGFWCEDILRVLGQIRGPYIVSAQNRERLAFLHETTSLVLDMVRKQFFQQAWKGFGDFGMLAKLVFALAKNLRNTDKVLKRIRDSGHTEITCNFDVLDMSVRRCFEELRTYLRGDVHCRPRESILISDVVSDILAAEAWAVAFGGNVHMVPFEDFRENIIYRQFPDAACLNKRFFRHLRHHVCFPGTSMVTTFRYNVLMCQFGHFASFCENFENYALQKGFVGCVNAIGAQTILSNYLNFRLRKGLPLIDCVIIRYSRTVPETLTYTCFDSRTSRFSNFRGMDSEGKSVPIRDFLSCVFPRYELVNVGVDDHATLIEDSLSYAEGTGIYVTSRYI